MAEIRVLLVDDHPVVRQGLRTFLELQPDLRVVGEASDGAEAESSAAELAPDVVLMDLVMPGVDGIEAIRRVREAAPGARVIVLTSFADDDKVVPAIQAGASGYLLKDLEPSELVDAIRTVHAGQSLLHPGAAATLVREVAGAGRAAGPSLTARELEVLRHIAAGESNKLIARALGVSEKTVKTHVSSVLTKLGLADRTQAALYAVREGLA